MPKGGNMADGLVEIDRLQGNTPGTESFTVRPNDIQSDGQVGVIIGVDAKRDVPITALVKDSGGAVVTTIDVPEGAASGTWRTSVRPLVAGVTYTVELSSLDNTHYLVEVEHFDWTT